MNTFATLAVAAAATLAATSIVHADTLVDTENPLDTTSSATAATTTTTETGAQTTQATTDTTAHTGATVETHATTHHSAASMFSIGASIGQMTQQTGGLLLYFPEHRNSLTETHLHAGYHPDRVVELGVNLELGAGDGLRSMAAIAEAKAYVLPMLPVSPTLTLGAGYIDEHAVSMSEDSTWRFALVGGVGLEGRMGRWSATLDMRLLAVRADRRVDWGSSMETEYTHGGIIGASFQAGASRTF